MKNKIDILNNKGEKTGEKIGAIEAHEQGVWHAVSHIWFYTVDGMIMVQLRARGKVTYPGMWDISAAGHVDAGEDILAATKREIKEEIGVDVEGSKLEKIFVRKNACIIPGNNWHNNEFQYVYIFRWEGSVDGLKLQTEEVEKVKLMSLEDFEKETLSNSGSNSFVPHGKDYFFKVIEEVKKRIIQKNGLESDKDR